MVLHTLREKRNGQPDFMFNGRQNFVFGMRPTPPTFHSTSCAQEASVSGTGRTWMPATSKTTRQLDLEEALTALDRIEPELVQLSGLIMVLRALGEADDSIEPAALASVARSALASFEEIDSSWRAAMAALRAG